ncbi:metallophosphoesterase [Fulvivirga sp.]|uniref:metallophosphoesterase n=2 Tax=Fulvivirga sp. TaxID=1931237 RepID=UPI0032EEBE0A
MLSISLIIFNLFTFSLANGDEIQNTIDGPYLFKTEEGIVGKWVEDSTLFQEIITADNYPKLQSKFNFKFGFEALTQDFSSQIDYVQENEGIDSLVAFSDIHGQYDLYIELLKANGIIDNDLNWSYGSGHMVIVGDIFDRGDKVTEVLWHVFGLEQQAEKAGGKVHLVLGNHEVMVLNNDLRYIHDKYKTTETLTSTTYDQLYADNTVLGQWLRSKPVAIKINDMIFAHGGLSPTLVNNDVSIEKINKTFADQILGRDRASILSDEFLELLYRSNGPVWYRGYFYDDNFTEQSIDSVLNYYDANHAIVGHCSYDSVITRFNNKIFGVDTSIKRGENGEVLKWNSGGYFKGTLSGEVKALPKATAFP